MLFQGEDVAAVQDRMDSDKEHYSKLQDQNQKRLNDLEEALPLAIQFKVAHNDLLQWFQKIDPEIHTAPESVGGDAEEFVQVGKPTVML